MHGKTSCQTDDQHSSSEGKCSFLLVKYDGKEEELPFDYGFVCLGMRANAPIWNDIQEAFVGEDVEVLNIGDSFRARRIIDGTDAGRHMVLNTLERLNYL